MKRWVPFFVLGIIVLGGAAWFVFNMDDAIGGEIDGEEAEEIADRNEDGWLDDEFGFERKGPDGPPPGDRSERHRRHQNQTPEEREARRIERRARREARLAAMSPEERAAFRQRRRDRFISRVNIVSHGESESGLTAEQLHEEIRPARRATRDCVRQLGDTYRQWRRSVAGADAGLREMSFEVSADGLVDAQSMQLTPEAPPEILNCFVTSYQNFEVTAPGEDAATVHIALPNRSRRQGSRPRGDAHPTNRQNLPPGGNIDSPKKPPANTDSEGRANMRDSRR